jgi:hypothetical protein
MIDDKEEQKELFLRHGKESLSKAENTPRRDCAPARVTTRSRSRQQTGINTSSLLGPFI